MSDLRVKSQIRALKTELRDMKYAGRWNESSIESGDPAMFLYILHFLFLDYNSDFAQMLADKNYSLQTATDLQFTQSVFTIMTEIFSYRPKIKITEFFKTGFAGQKVTLMSDAAKHIKAYCLKKGK